MPRRVAFGPCLAIYRDAANANPNSNVSGGGFGTISATHSFAGDPRIIQFGLKLQF